ncbi:MAG: pyrroline-5-carboxylate reductase [Burkholderiales bacterium]
MKIAFIGGGNMASALIGGLVRKGWQPERMRVVDVDAAARERIAKQFGVAAHESPEAGVEGADCVVFAVKPQQLQQVARALAPRIAGMLVVSIAAGIRARDLSRWLGGHARIVRAMPNTPALVLAGMTGLYADGHVAAEDRHKAEEVLSAAGATLWVASEEQMDAVTAVSGSGPAYVFYFLESLERAATELGFDAAAARRLAVETFSGAVKLAADSRDELATLRARVTSRGGTTERALSVLDTTDVRASIVRAVRAAAERSRELGDELGADAPGLKGGM